MALPTSTIAMAVLTCIPFGLAIRDTVNGTTYAPRAADYGSDDSDFEAEYAADNARREAEEAAEAAAERLEQAKQEELRIARRALYGAEVATLGSGFTSISLGMNDGEIRLPAVAALETKARVQIDLLANGTLDWIVIRPEDDDCDGLGEDLQEAWGRGETEDYESRFWINPTTGTRASLASSDGCRINFERFAAPRAWITKARTSVVPTWLVGQSVSKLREHLGPDGAFDDAEPTVRWVGLGVGMGSGDARFEAHLVKGKVVALTATTDTFDTTRDEVVTQLTALHGEPIEDAEGLRWKSRPAIALDDYDGAGIRITVGTLPVGE